MIIQYILKERYNNGIAANPHAIFCSYPQVLFIINDHPIPHKHNIINDFILLSNGLVLFLFFPKTMNAISKNTTIRKNDAGEHKFAIVEYIYYIYTKKHYE